MADPAASEPPPSSGPGRRWRLLSDELFARTEHLVYIVIAALLAVTAGLALAGAGLLLWHGFLDWRATDAVFETVDRLLFVLMLIEILHTVRVSIRSGGLAAEPFLIVGLIASIRRVLVITLETSEAMRGRTWTEPVIAQFHASMIELAVLGALILIMVVSIYLLHDSGARQATTEAPASPG